MNANQGSSGGPIPAGHLLEALMASAVDAIIVIDDQGRIEWFSDSAERLFGYSREEVIGGNVSRLMPTEHRRAHDGYMDRYHETGEKRIIGLGREVTARARDGTEFPIDLAVGETRIGDRRAYVGILRDLRHRSHLEASLRRARSRAERVRDLVDVVIVGLDVEGRVHLANRKAAEMVGHPAPLVGEDWLQWVQAEDREAVRGQIRQLHEQRAEAPEAAEYALLAAGDENRHLAWRLQFVAGDGGDEADLLLCAGIDLTDMRRVTQLLRRSEEQLRLTFEQAPVGIARLDRSGKIVAANATLGRLLGERPAALENTPFHRLLDGGGRTRAEAAFNRLVTGEVDQVALSETLSHKAQTIKARLFAGVLRDAEGEPVSVLVQIEDRTHQIAAEAEIDQLRGRLAHVQRLSLMGEMAAGIAHEVNQPLSAISTFSDGARRLMGSERPRLDDIGYALEQIGQQARRAGDVIKRMRAMARNQVVARQPADINALIKGLVSLAQLEARDLGSPLHLDLAERLPPVRVDEVQIQQVILNLIRNSLEALATRSQASKGITISTRKVGDDIRITVSDHGVGINEDVARRIFDPFYSSKPTGTGMGLSICSTIVRGHEGRLWYEPNEGGGSRFCVSLPVATMQIEDQVQA